jgi:putative membrane protein
MWLDAALAYLHFIAIFTLFAFMSVQLVLVKGVLDARVVRTLARMDLWYFGSAIVVLTTGFLRATLGAKGPDFYFNAWPIYAKIALFIVVGVISVKPTLTFIAWRRAYERDAAWHVPEAEQARVRRLLLLEIHVAALIPVFAVIMSRGLGR